MSYQRYGANKLQKVWSSMTRTDELSPARVGRTLADRFHGDGGELAPRKALKSGSPVKARSNLASSDEYHVNGADENDLLPTHGAVEANLLRATHSEMHQWHTWKRIRGSTARPQHCGNCVCLTPKRRPCLAGAGAPSDERKTSKNTSENRCQQRQCRHRLAAVARSQDRALVRRCAARGINLQGGRSAPE
jgi:hypothetical protein